MSEDDLLVGTVLWVVFGVAAYHYQPNPYIKWFDGALGEFGLWYGVGILLCLIAVTAIIVHEIRTLGSQALFSSDYDDDLTDVPWENDQ